MNSVTIDRFNNDPPCRVLIFTSPKAGSGANREQIPRLQRMLEDLGVECAVTHSVDDLQRQQALSSETHDTVIVAAGGDGTMSLAVSTVSSQASTVSSQASAGSSQASAGSSQASAGSSQASAGSLQASASRLDLPIVPMPLGTENLLARQFGYTAEAQSIVQTIRHGTSYRLDAAAAGEHLFLIMATCGFDAEVVRGMHLTRRGHIRRISYLGPILRATRKYKFPKILVRIDEGEPLECCWAMVFNLPRYAGGLKIEPDAVGDDGLLDVIAFKHGSILSGLKYVAGIWFGRHLSFRDVVRRRGSTIDISSNQRVPFQLDGDYAGKLPLRIKALPRKVHLLLPPS